MTCARDAAAALRQAWGRCSTDSAMSHAIMGVLAVLDAVAEQEALVEVGGAISKLGAMVARHWCGVGRELDVEAEVWREVGQAAKREHDELRRLVESQRVMLREREKQLDPESIQHWDTMREQRDEAQRELARRKP